MSNYHVSSGIILGHIFEVYFSCICIFRYGKVEGLFLKLKFCYECKSRDCINQDLSV